MPPLHEPILGTRTLHWLDERDCAAFAADLALRPTLRDAIVELHGPLGAGKTTFVRHLLRALGVEGRVKSPSYAVLEPYRARGLTIAHLDCYRFDDPGEWVDAGLRDVFAAPGLKLVEWPEKAAGQLPPADLRLTIEPLDGSDGGRHVIAEPLSARGRELLA
jgi:tRNA threonylcarbamoyladenosine biosynthesis protein TsaE